MNQEGKGITEGIGITIQVSAKDMRAATADPKVDVVPIQIPGVVNAEKAVCIECGKEDASDLEHLKFRALMEGLAWMHNKACGCIEQGIDLRAFTVDALINEAMMALTAGIPTEFSKQLTGAFSNQEVDYKKLCITKARMDELCGNGNDLTDFEATKIGEYLETPKEYWLDLFQSCNVEEV